MSAALAVFGFLAVYVLIMLLVVITIGSEPVQDDELSGAQAPKGEGGSPAPEEA